MPRKRLAASAWHPAAQRVIPGLSGAGESAITKLEQDRFRPGEIGTAYRLWRRTVTGPFARWEQAVTADGGEGFADDLDCPCCDATDRGRSTLDRAIRMLGPRAAGELRRQVGRLDACIWARARRTGATHRLVAWSEHRAFAWHC